MNNIFISPEEIQKELLDIEHEGRHLALKLSLLSQKIKYIFSLIHSCETIEQADTYFNMLDALQSVLAKLVFNHGIGLSKRLTRFVKDFDNLDFYKNYYFEKIKKNEYKF
jgi:hypothetical protein